MNAKLGKFPPFPPQAQWGFRACPALARFTCLDYSCKALAQKKDPSFADRLPAEWKAKYQGWWPATPYLEIPESVRLAAEPELDPAKLQEIMAKELVPNEPIHQEAFEVFQSCIAIGELPVYEDMTGAYALIKIPRGLARTTCSRVPKHT